MTGLILTPGQECESSSTEHYSVYVAQRGRDQAVGNDDAAVFASPGVKGALLLQHHMMTYDVKLDCMVVKSREAIQAEITRIKSVNSARVQQGLLPLQCFFDAEPVPVAQRRYYHNPEGWPEQDGGRIERLAACVRLGRQEQFLRHQIDEDAYYPLLPSNQSLGNLALTDSILAAEISEFIGAITGRVMGELGIEVLYAPVCDLQARAFEERCYSDREEVTIDLAHAWSKGALSQSGIKGICLKHAPGHGVTINAGQEGRQDTHDSMCSSADGLAAIERHMGVFTEVSERLLENGFAKESIQVMTNHIKYLALDPENVVSCSESAIAFIKSRLPLGVELVADCINMSGYGTGYENLSKTMALHKAGVIATTHYVKKMTRQELIAAVRHLG